ncbi:MAG TPA: hypothetical protein VF993_11065 [Myxococcales bacterium]
MDARRAAGAALRGVRRRGEPLRPALAIEALLAAMRARFQLDAETVDKLLRPALADWRDAVGCADPLLMPANALTEEKALVPLPMPSWCAWLVESGVLRLDGPPAVEGPRVVQAASLLVMREAELSAVERFSFAFAGRYGSGAASLHVHLAISPPFLSPAWRAPILLRAAAQRLDQKRAPVPLWLGPPASPQGTAAGATGERVATWAVESWPRWAILRVLEGREPQALWDLRALRAEEPGEIGAGPPGTMRLGVDIGSTSTVVVEEDSAVAGSVGSKLLRAACSSGFRRLAGDPLTAHQVGCAEHLLAPGGQLPTALAAATPSALFHPGQMWLPQAPPAGAPAGDAGLLIDRFKSPELLLLSDWLGEAPDLDRAQMSRRLLMTYAHLLGRTLAAAHAAPLVMPEGGRWAQRLPRLGAAEATVTYPQCAFDAESSEPFSSVFDEVGRELCRGLSAAWATASHRLVADPAAARAARAQDARNSLEAFVDFGGLTLQITIHVPRAAGRPAPFIAGSSMSYLLGGERLIDSGAFASASVASGDLREAWRAIARRWRALISGGGHLQDGVEAVGDAILETVFALVRRQLEGTLRRAAALRGAGVRLYLLGEGWKLVALDAPDEDRERETLRRIEDHLAAQPLLPGAALQLQRMDKRRVCEGALRVHGAESSEDAVELQGVDVASSEGLRQRWFGIAGGLSGPDLSPSPHDRWWLSFAGGGQSLLRMEQWFSTPAPFETRLEGGNLAFDAQRSFLKQWLDVSGPSLVALRINSALRDSAT